MKRTVHLDVRMTDAEREALAELAAAEALSASVLVRRLIREAHARLVADAPKGGAR